METVYLVCAVAGGTLLVCQFLMTLAGLGGDHDLGDHDVAHDIGHDATGHDHDAGHDHGNAWFVGVLTFRTIVAAVAFFGLAGKFAAANELAPMQTFGLATASGVAALFLVAAVMKAMMRLRSDGTVRIERTVGTTGIVYLSIPASRGGVGKVTLSLQNRTVELQAVTAEPNDLPTGTKVVTVAVLNSGTVEVALAPCAEGVAHV